MGSRTRERMGLDGGCSGCCVQKRGIPGGKGMLKTKEMISWLLSVTRLLQERFVLRQEQMDSSEKGCQDSEGREELLK